MNTVDTSLFDAVRTDFLTETRRVGGESHRQFGLIIDRIDEASDHGMFGCADQIEVFTFNLVHHVFHFLERHNAGNNFRTDHERRNAIGEAFVDHVISGICQDGRM